jgi:hypothetical protein
MALTFNLPSQIVVQTAAQWAADNTVYSNKRILVTSDVYYGSTDQRKFKIADGTQTWTQLDYMPIGVDVNSIGTAINGATSATPNDTDLVMSVDTSVAKKNTWTQIKTFLKTYFDTVYAATSSLANYVTLGTIQTITAQKTFQTSNNTPTIVATHTSGSGEVLQINKSGNGEGIIINKLSGSGVAMSIYGASINLDALTAGQILELNANKVVISVAKNSGYNLALGTTAGTVLEGNRITQTITNGVVDKAPSEDAVFDALDGVTSAIQTQIDSKSEKSILLFAANLSPADLTDYYFSIAYIAATTSPNGKRFKFETGSTTAIKLALQIASSSNPSNELVTLNLRNITTSTDYLIGTFDWSLVLGNTNWLFEFDFSHIIDTTDQWAIKMTTPTWVTNPTAAFMQFKLYYK